MSLAIALLTVSDTRTLADDRSGDALQQRLPEFCALLVREGRKTWGDAVAEVRERSWGEADEEREDAYDKGRGEGHNGYHHWD